MTLCEHRNPRGHCYDCGVLRAAVRRKAPGAPPDLAALVRANAAKLAGPRRHSVNRPPRVPDPTRRFGDLAADPDALVRAIRRHQAGVPANLATKGDK